MERATYAPAPGPLPMGYAPQQAQIGYAPQSYYAPQLPMGYVPAQQQAQVGYAPQMGAPPLPAGYVPAQQMGFAAPPPPLFFASQASGDGPPPPPPHLREVVVTKGDAAPPLFVPEEPVLHEGRRACCWSCLRWVECSLKADRACPLWCVLYGLFGVACREEERQSYRATVMPSRLVVNETTYDCGCCCRKYLRVSVPLPLVMEVEYADDCGCDHVFVRVFDASKPDAPKRNCCGCRENVIDLVCLEDPRGMAAALSDAKQRRPAAAAAGAAKM